LQSAPVRRFGVADGLGGHAGGERASRLAVQTIQQTISVTGFGRPRIRSTRSARRFWTGIEAAKRQGSRPGHRAATTLVLVEIRDRICGRTMSAIRDSLGRPARQAEVQTIAHSPIGLRVEAGLIDEKMRFSTEERHVISNVIGSTGWNRNRPKSRWPRCDTLVLASDGILDNLCRPKSWSWCEPAHSTKRRRSGGRGDERMNAQTGRRPRSGRLTVIASSVLVSCRFSLTGFQIALDRRDARAASVKQPVVVEIVEVFEGETSSNVETSEFAPSDQFPEGDRFQGRRQKPFSPQRKPRAQNRNEEGHKRWNSGFNRTRSPSMTDGVEATAVSLASYSRHSLPNCSLFTLPILSA